MLTVLLDMSPEVFATKGEARFFEHVPELGRLTLDKRIRKIVSLIGASQQPPMPPRDREILVDELVERSGSFATNQDWSPVDMYATALESLSRRNEARRWAQKATSYIFYLETILDAFPNAKLIYLVRNPLDVAASLKRRGNTRYFLNMVWAWNKGATRAMDYRNRYPDNFLLVRYEDVVRDAENIVRHIFDFAGLSFDPAFLQIPHVNKSETAYNLDSDQKGITNKKTEYYRYVLTPVEEMTIRSALSQDMFDALYPDLAADRPILRWWDIPKVFILNAAFAGFLVGRQLINVFQNPGHAVRRIRRRMM